MSRNIKEMAGALVLDCRKRDKVRTSYVSYPPTDERPGKIDMFYLSEGSASFRFSDHVVTIYADDILFFETGTLIERQALSGKPLSFYYLIFTPLDINGRMSFSETGLPEVCVSRKPHILKKHLDELVTLFSEKEPGWLQTSSSRLLEILGSIMPQTNNNQSPTEGPDDRLTVKRIGDQLDYINENYKKRISVDDLAARANIHPIHFNRLFKKVTGLTPHRYILEKKVAKAKDFLLHYNESMTSTALELGFYDYTHFARVFKAISGQTPRQFLASSKKELT